MVFTRRWASASGEKKIFQQKSFRVTASIGIASLVPGALEPPEALVHSADKALYRAKANGRNMVCASAIEDNVAQI